MATAHWNAKDLYKVGYELHYTHKQLEVAYGVYSTVITSYASEKEAQYAEQQINELKKINPDIQPDNETATLIVNSGEIPTHLTKAHQLKTTQKNEAVHARNFCHPDEKAILTIGSGYVANFISGSGAGQVGATLTNKRIYFSGNVYTLDNNGKLQAVKQQKIVNVRDVTGNGYTTYSPIHLMIYGIFALLGGILSFAMEVDFSNILNIFGGVGLSVGVALIIAYFATAKTLLVIEYAGGNIAFNAAWLMSNEQDTFIKTIHLAKDKLYSTAAADQGFAPGGE